MASVEKVELEEKSVKEDQPFVKSDDEKKFVRKLYICVLPLIWCIIFIQVNLKTHTRIYIYNVLINVLITIFYSNH